MGQDPAQTFAEAVSIMARLRAPDGCPWDREQNFDTIRKYTLEETYEVLDAIERRNWPDLQEELGDLLLQVLFYAQMAAEAGHFNINDVVDGLNQKLVRRHPHVFGDEAAAAAGNGAAGLEVENINAAQVLRNWDAIKQAEKARAGVVAAAGRLDGIPRSLPALIEAAKLGSKAAKSGFDWPDTKGLFDKLQEETAELHEAIAAHGTDATEARKAAIANELGDLLFTAVNLARHLGVDPEMALRGTNAKFRRRFATMEVTNTRALESLSSDELEQLWISAKQREGAERK
jgi:ATP diphosphatase